MNTVLYIVKSTSRGNILKNIGSDHLELLDGDADVRLADARTRALS